MNNKVNVYLSNRMKQKLLQGKVVVGTGASNQGGVDKAGLQGYDFVRFEGEHGNISRFFVLLMKKPIGRKIANKQQCNGFKGGRHKCLICLWLL